MTAEKPNSDPHLVAKSNHKQHESSRGQPALGTWQVEIHASTVDFGKWWWQPSELSIYLSGSCLLVLYQVLEGFIRMFDGARVKICSLTDKEKTVELVAANW
jgi:hypothetical protein